MSLKDEFSQQNFHTKIFTTKFPQQNFHNKIFTTKFSQQNFHNKIFTTKFSQRKTLVLIIYNYFRRQFEITKPH